MSNHYDKVRQMVLIMLEKSGPNINSADILKQVKKALAALDLTEDDVVVDDLVRDIETSMSVWVKLGGVLDGKDLDHIGWLNEDMTFTDPKRETTKWPFWRRYNRYLFEIKHRQQTVLDSMAKSTTKVLLRLEDPQRPGAWDQRGMVVGEVQSGKTMHYTGLICKAADAGYKIIVVLAGLHDSLRSQTQLRLDEEFLGFPSDRAYAFSTRCPRIGVANLFAEELPPAHTLTNSTNNGDFSLQIANQAGVTPGSAPILLVIKKNVTILKNLNRWVQTIPNYDESNKKVRNMPILVIDDECDLASINTRQTDLDNPEYDVTATNQQIRILLKTFEKVAYVGYTATPFANIFIHPDKPHIEYGEDLFPRSFIVTTDQPSNYIGPVQVFGLEPDSDGFISPRQGLPIVEIIKDHDKIIPDRHQISLYVKCLPESLKLAIRMFIISSAVRFSRGATKQHNSMLIHVSRFVTVQTRIRELVEAELTTLRERIRYRDGSPKGGETEMLMELRKVYEENYIPKTESMNPADPVAPFDDIIPHLIPAVSKMTIKTINGEAQDILDYHLNKDGLNVIVIGGDKLSRGLTLEGLTVSYYLRAANAYDTLMQMGRWFGYRDGFLDLCRIFTTEVLKNLYQWIAMATEELRRDFVRMQERGETPSTFGLRVKSHPGSLLVTALNKQRSAREIMISFENHLVQTLAFDTAQKTIENNLQATDRFLHELGKSAIPDVPREIGCEIWRDVPVQNVMKYLKTYQPHDDNPLEISNMELILNYIQKETEKKRLVTWTVCMDNSGKGVTKSLLGGAMRRTVVRKPMAAGGARRTQDKVTLKGLTNPIQEASDLTKEQFDAALAESVEEWNRKTREPGRKTTARPPNTPYPDYIRDKRPSEKGLLMLYAIDPKSSDWGISTNNPVIGIGISFPPVQHGEKTTVNGSTYVANVRYLRGILDDA